MSSGFALIVILVLAGIIGLAWLSYHQAKKRRECRGSHDPNSCCGGWTCSSRWSTTSRRTFGATMPAWTRGCNPYDALPTVIDPGPG
jgi:hypothetical protein